MDSDLFSQIKARYNSFSKAELKVADYILKNKDSVIYMSITDLADACDVGESSVFRFCKSMDLKGYQELKIRLAHSDPISNETPQLSNEISINDSTSELISKLYAANTQALNETSKLISTNDVIETVNMLVDAERIHFFGVGSSSVTAMEAHNKFIRITNKTACTMDSHMQIMTASLMAKNDVAVLISYSGSTKDTIEVAKAAHKRGVKIIAITRFAKSPLTNYADYTLLCGAHEGPLQGGSLSVKISQLFLLDILYAEYFKQTQHDSIQNKDVTAKSVLDKLL